jgi:hypothetical protein
MKKLLLIGLILAILLLAFPQGVMAVDDDQAVINANLAGVTLNFKVTEPGGMWELARGANTLGTTDATKIKIEVDTSNYWTVSAEDTTTAHKGHMISAGTPATFLTQVLYIQKTVGNGPLSAKVDVGSGNPGNYSNTVFYRTLDQEVLTTDKAMTDYKITLTFTVTES